MLHSNEAVKRACYDSRLTHASSFCATERSSFSSVVIRFPPVLPSSPKALLDVERDRQCPAQCRKATRRYLHALGAFIDQAPAARDEAPLLESPEHQRHLHRVDLGQPCDLRLQNGFARTGEPRRRRERRELEVREIERRERPVDLGLTYCLRAIDDGNVPFVAIPVFPHRAFRHSAIYINEHRECRSRTGGRTA